MLVEALPVDALVTHPIPLLLCEVYHVMHHGLACTLLAQAHLHDVTAHRTSIRDRSSDLYVGMRVVDCTIGKGERTSKRRQKLRK